MRRDIDKLVFERAKSGRTWASKTPRAPAVKLDSTGDQFDEKYNWIRLYRQKHRNSHFNPVEHFLVGCVGRPWDKVFAEICASVDSRSTLGAEIRDHVACAVAIHCWMEGRKVMTGDWGEPREVRGLYVHPKTGLLQRTPDAPRRPKR
jgi:hypothetical protein